MTDAQIPPRKSDLPHVRRLVAERFGEELVPLEDETHVFHSVGDATCAHDMGGRLCGEPLTASVHVSADPLDDRARFVAALHALGEWYLDHPAMPLPDRVSFGATVDTLEEVARLAEAFGAPTYGPDGCQFDVDPGIERLATRKTWLIVSRNRDSGRPL